MSVPVENRGFCLIGAGKSEEIWQIFDTALTKFVTRNRIDFLFIAPPMSGDLQGLTIPKKQDIKPCYRMPG